MDAKTISVTSSPINFHENKKIDYTAQIDQDELNYFKTVDISNSFEETSTEPENQSKCSMIYRNAISIGLSIKNGVLYCIFTVKYWLSYTFCCIVIKRRKTPGVLRSVRI